MSQLIEALRKAEEAKRKEAEVQPASDEFSLQLEPMEASVEQAKSNVATPEMEEPDFEDDLELETTLPNQPAPLQETTEEKIQTALNEQIDNDLDAQSEEIEASSPRRRLTDEQKIQEEEARIVEKSHRKRLYLLFLIAFIIVAGFAGYYFFVIATGNHQYSATPATNQNRGFLGSEEIRSSRDALINQTLNQNTGANEVQVLLGDTQLLQEELAADGNETTQDSRTISAVNALVATSLEETLKTDDYREASPVFTISQSIGITESSQISSLIKTDPNLGNTDAISNELPGLLAKEPNNITALSRLAQLQSASGNYHQAAEIYTRILELDPRNAAASAGLTKAVRSEDPLHYESGLRQLAMEHPNAAFIPFMLGNHLSSEQRWTEAKNAYEDAINLSGGDVFPDYHFNLAVSLERLHQPDAALQQYKQAALSARQKDAGFDTDLLDSRISKLEGTQ